MPVAARSGLSAGRIVTSLKPIVKPELPPKIANLGGKSMVVGIDPSLGAAAVVSGNSNLPASELTAKVLSAPPCSLSLLPRLKRYNKHAEEIIKAFSYVKPDLIIIEGYSFGSSGRGTLSLAEFGGILRKELIDAGHRVIEISPTSLKKYITGKGNSSKLEVVSALIRCTDAAYKTDDEYDALACWMIGCAYLNPALTTRASQRDVLAQLRAEESKPA